MAEKNLAFTGSLYQSSGKLAKMLSELAEREFKQIGLSPSYAFLLMAVNDQPGIQPSQLSEIMDLDPSTISRLVEKMEYQGYVDRVSEGRSTHIHPTDMGKDLDTKIGIAWKKLEKQYVECLGERYAEVLTEMTQNAVTELQEIV